MVYKIADLRFEIDFKYPCNYAKCKEYLCEGESEADTTVCVSQEEIDYEKASDTELASKFSDAYFEWLAVFRKVCAEVLQRDAFMMHGAVIEYEGKGYVFTAKSGTGKTTHIRLWKKLFGNENVTIVNGDKPILRFVDGKVYAYGTPWCGKEGYNTNVRVPVAGICFLERAEQNSIKKISDEEAIPKLFSQIMIHDSAHLAKQLELVDALLNKVSTYTLKCNMDVEAARISYEGMSAGKQNDYT